jgi:hypothetical protein
LLLPGAVGKQADWFLADQPARVPVEKIVLVDTPGKYHNARRIKSKIRTAIFSTQGSSQKKQWFAPELLFDIHTSGLGLQPTAIEPKTCLPVV